MRILPFSNVLVLSSCLLLLAACGGDTSSSSSSGGSAGTGGTGSTTTSATVTSTAVLHVGRSGGEAAYHVFNTALSVLDANGAPVDNLDGGDFRIIAASNDYEGHHRAQKMNFPTQVTGHLILMLDISNDMAPRFAELQTAAVRLVNKAIAIGLPIDVYKFWSTGTVALVGSATDLGTATTLNTAINALTPQVGNTFFYESVATVVNARLGNNSTVYSHNTPTTPPTSHVEVMIIMSDGLESPGTTNSAGDVTTLSDGVYWITTIAVGDNPDVAALKGITTNSFPVTEVPAGGTYSDAVDNEMTFIDNYYHGFYLVEYQVTDLLSASESYDIKLIDNDSSKITRGPFDATLLSTAWLTQVCCEVWAAPGEGVDATGTVVINATLGNTMEFQVVQLWSNITNTNSNVTWTLSGNMTGEQDPLDPTKYTITTTGNTGSGSLTATVGGWSSTIPITLN